MNLENSLEHLEHIPEAQNKLKPKYFNSPPNSTTNVKLISGQEVRGSQLTTMVDMEMASTHLAIKKVSVFFLPANLFPIKTKQLT